MSEYVPTTADMRHGYIVTSMRYTPETDDHLLAKRRREVAAEFDAWLDGVCAEARREGQAEAWDEGVVVALNHAIRNPDGITLRLEHLDGTPWPNPYGDTGGTR